MAQAQSKQQRSTSKEAVVPTEVEQNEGESLIARKNSGSVSIADISHAETPPLSGTDDEPAVRRWQDLIASSLALEEQARENDRWNIRQSAPFLLCLSGAFWALLIVSVLSVS